MALDLEGGKVEAVDREVYLHVELATAEHRVARVREPLEMADKEFWCFVDLHLLECWHMIFALGAVPLVVASESLLLPEAGEAVIDRYVL